MYSSSSFEIPSFESLAGMTDIGSHSHTTAGSPQGANHNNHYSSHGQSSPHHHHHHQLTQLGAVNHHQLTANNLHHHHTLNSVSVHNHHASHHQLSPQNNHHHVTSNHLHNNTPSPHPHTTYPLNHHSSIMMDLDSSSENLIGADSPPDHHSHHLLNGSSPFATPSPSHSPHNGGSGDGDGGSSCVGGSVKTESGNHSDSLPPKKNGKKTRGRVSVD